jgi:hypothetical protein
MSSMLEDPDTEKAVSDRRNTIRISSPDHYSVNIMAEESGAMKGLILVISNERLNALASYKVVIRSGQSFDSKHSDYRDGIEFIPFSFAAAEPIFSSSNGKGLWFIHKRPESAQLFTGNDDGHILRWPDNNKSLVQKWRIGLEAVAFQLPKPKDTSQPPNPIPLKPIQAYIVIIWNTAQSSFHIESHALAKW